MTSPEAKVISVNVSIEKGTIKRPVPAIELGEKGVAGDAHSGTWHRQVSLLGKESYQHFFEKYGRFPDYGEFAENITTSGILLYKCHPLDMLVGEGISLEITQIGKKCHGDRCAIFKEVGNCVMPTEGIFARVVKSGVLKPEDSLIWQPKIWKSVVITLSDRAFSGEYDDRSGPAIVKRLEQFFQESGRKYSIVPNLIPDDPGRLEAILSESTDADLIITTGGTGIGKRDFTPDVVQKLIHRQIPGIMENIRSKYGSGNPAAFLSRGIAGTFHDALVFTLPGSVRAVNEYIDELIPVLDHAWLMIHGIDGH